MKGLITLLISFCTTSNLLSQTLESYGEGYAIFDRDTIKCQVLIDQRLLFKDSVLIRQNNINKRYAAGGPLTGYGYTEDGVEHHYGAIPVNRFEGIIESPKTRFVKKVVKGVVDLYEYHYQVMRTKGSGVTTVEEVKEYYIVYNDSTGPGNKRAKWISPSRKKLVAPYLPENPGLLNKLEAKFTTEELIAVLEEYNAWMINKRN